MTGGRRQQRVPITEEGVLALQFGSNGRYMAMGGRRTALLWDLGEGRARFQVEAPWTVAVALSPDCETLATAGADGLRFRRTATGKLTGAFRPEHKIKCLAYSPDGSLLAAGDFSGYVTVWDTSTRRKRWSAGCAVGPPTADLYRRAERNQSAWVCCPQRCCAAAGILFVGFTEDPVDRAKPRFQVD